MLNPVTVHWSPAGSVPSSRAIDGSATAIPDGRYRSKER